MTKMDQLRSTRFNISKQQISLHIFDEILFDIFDETNLIILQC